MLVYSLHKSTSLDLEPAGDPFASSSIFFFLFSLGSSASRKSSQLFALYQYTYTHVRHILCIHTSMRHETFAFVPSLHLYAEFLVSAMHIYVCILERYSIRCRCTDRCAWQATSAISLLPPHSRIYTSTKQTRRSETVPRVYDTLAPASVTRNVHLGRVNGVSGKLPSRLAIAWKPLS